MTKDYGGAFTSALCGLPRKRKKYSASCRWCAWQKGQLIESAISGLSTRVASKIEILGSGCWLWLGAKNRRGYGMVRVEGTMQLAHRAIYGALIGEIPKGHHLHHYRGCAKHCVNPEHLEPISPAEHGLLHSSNNASWREKMKRRTHCHRNHEMTPENTYTYKGQRKCKTCRRAANERWAEAA